MKGRYRIKKIEQCGRTCLSLFALFLAFFTVRPRLLTSRLATAWPRLLPLDLPLFGRDFVDFPLLGRDFAIFFFK